MSFNLPTIKVEDLNAFHVQHFGALPHGGGRERRAQNADDNSYEDNDLGDYNDGTKRSLTDDEVAWFRAKEIRQLLQERKARKIAQATGEDALQTQQQPPVSRKPGSSQEDPARAKSKFDYKHEHYSRQKPNRRARELDIVQNTSVELDY